MYSNLTKRQISPSNYYYLISAILFISYFLLLWRTNVIISFIVLVGIFVVFWLGHEFIRLPAIGIGLMVIGTSLDQMGRIGGLPITVFHVAVLITFAAVSIRAFRMGHFDFNLTTFNLPLMLFLLLISFSLIYTPDKADALLHFSRVIALVIIMYLVINAIDNPLGVYIIVFCLLMSAFVLAIIGVWSIAGTSSSLMQAALGFMKLFGRFGVTFENPNYFATFLMLAIATGFALVLNASMNVGWKLIILLMMAVMAMAFVGTFSRAAWIALVPASIIVIAFSKYRRLMILGTPVLLLIIAVIIWQTAFFKSFILRLSSMGDVKGDPSSVTRLLLMWGGIKMFFKSYLLGVGFRGFPLYYTQYYRPSSQVLYEVAESHTWPVEVLAELGLVGFILFTVIWFRYTRFAVNSINSIKHPSLRACQIGMLASMIGLLVNSLFSPGTIGNNFLWIGFGLIYAIDNVAQKVDESKVSVK